MKNQVKDINDKVHNCPTFSCLATTDNAIRADLEIIKKEITLDLTTLKEEI